MREPKSDPGQTAATKTFAVLGGVAAGKSTAARLLAGPDGLVLEADALAHEVLEAPETRVFLIERFGPEAAPEGAGVDRAFLAERVFSNQEELKALEDWIHPRVRDRIWAEWREAQARSVPRIVLDVPLLMESEALEPLRNQVDYLVFLDVPLEERERRAVTQRGWNRGEVARREAAQMPLKEKRQAAHFVLEATGTLADLQQKIQAFLTECGA